MSLAQFLDVLSLLIRVVKVGFPGSMLGTVRLASRYRRINDDVVEVLTDVAGHSFWASLANGLGHVIGGRIIFQQKGVLLRINLCIWALSLPV
jgi:hypothetical protein